MKKQLSHLKDRLNDISKRNRSIRLLRLYNKWNLDLYELNCVLTEGITDGIIDQIIDQKDRISLLTIKGDDADKLALSQRLTTLFRNMKSIEDETGLYDFYFGYPFLTGTMLDGTYFQAPLFLYPLRLERKDSSNRNWELHREDGDPQLNRSLFLALKKINGMNLEEAMFEEASEIAKTKNMEQWLEWLSTYDIKVTSTTDTTDTIERFQSYTADETPNLPKGTMEIRPFSILGNFPQGNSSLLRDYEALMELSEETMLGLSQEILDIGDATREGHVLATAGEETKIANRETNEKDKFYLMQTDGSQEEILEEARYRKGLVVHGPPGTGKSQVIVNLMTDAVQMNKKVLLVCQKRAALDVVYQRLESLHLSPHVALVHDEKHDRKALYTKIQQLIQSSGLYDTQVEQELESTSSQLESREKILNNIAKGLFEIQPFGYRAYDLYGMVNRSDEMENIVDLANIIDQLHKNNLDDTLAEVYNFGEFYEQYGSSDYPLVKRHSFAQLEIKDRMTIAKILQQVIEKAKQSAKFMDSLDQKKLTPAYTWIISDKLEKIYDDLDSTQKRTLQQLRLWWWTSFTGKGIIEELLNGEKFKGLSSSDWPKVSESLRILYDLGKVTEEMSTELDQLEPYVQKEEIERLKKMVSEGKMPLRELDRMYEYLLRDFEALRQMDRIYEQSTPLVINLIDMARKHIQKPKNLSLAEHWVKTMKHSAYIHWIDMIEKKHPEIPTVSTDQYERLRSSFSDLIEKKRELSQKALVNTLVRRLSEVREEHPRAMKELNHQVSKKRMIWPVRKLVNEFSNQGLTDILPVWLSSPEIVSAIFPLSEAVFDLVIFDEASQCAVESGIQLFIVQNK
ncbi:DUF4011 domain-containing protein [Caldalkalibacillus mannanilyticus]|uniref:DUF4011 domain-containing protein n=1 Tax=Caldalkalibacillus mannanilyticus TaxID=1418 RepID=UPI000ACD1B77|nr:DUF4011 domain-containing protein [Caldalkalibacillus mannanilyticus]